MSESEQNFSRRHFIKTVGAASLGLLSGIAYDRVDASTATLHGSSESRPVPTRPFGNTGVLVPILGLGGSQDLKSKPLLLRQAVKMGVTYWDTAYAYHNSEEAIGDYFTRYPQDRKLIFLVTKTESSDPVEMNFFLQRSLERLKTSYFDLYLIHKVSRVKNHFNQETRAWVEKAKSKGKIRFFGFSTHKNMESCLLDAAGLGWIDGIMTSYNYRLMNKDAMRRAVDACVKAGIGLTAMKTQAPFLKGLVLNFGREDETTKKMTEHFMDRGFTLEQAKLKAVWQNPNIASICSEMTNMTILKANVAAAMDKTELSKKAIALFDQQARETAYAYCAGCADRCESKSVCNIPVSNVLRYLMYYYGYGERDRARRLFHQIPKETKQRIALADYSLAEKRCPHGIPISRYMKDAVELFA